MTIKEEAKQICEKMKKMLYNMLMYPVKQDNGAYEYQRHGLSYSVAREFEGYITGYAEALDIKVTNRTLIKIRETSNFKEYYLLSIEFMNGRTF